MWIEIIGPKVSAAMEVKNLQVAKTLVIVIEKRLKNVEKDYSY